MTPEGLIVESLFKIADKDGSDVPFRLNTVQRAIDETLTGRDLYPKARQEGVSSYFLGRYTAACLGAGSRRNVRAVVISHDQESTQRMLGKVRYFLENIRGPKPILRNNSANEITFPKTNSMFYIGTAGARKFGRGDTITHLHCSEFAYWPNPAELAAGLFQAVPTSGEIAIESTGNGMNDYAQRCLRAASGGSQYAMHFFNWQDFPEYTDQVTDEEAESILSSLSHELEEDKLVPALSAGQIAWRRRKLEELSYDLRRFKQEYPMTLDECFQASGRSIFYKVLFSPSDEWVHVPDRINWYILEGHPNPVYTYVVGADVAAGVERDSSSIQVVCMDTMEQVAEYDSNKVPPDEFADQVIWAGETFNNAYTVVEQNNHGLVTLAYMRGRYPSFLIHTERRRSGAGLQKGLSRMGLRTTGQSKPLMIGRLRRAVAESLVIHSQVLMNQMTTFIERENGELGADDGCHDDLVIAAACAVWGMDRGRLIQGDRIEKDAVPPPSPFLLETIIDELKGRSGSFPVGGQHEGSM
jgi:hypothetical protein